MVYMLSTIVYAVAALSVASTFAAPVPNDSRFGVRTIDAKFEARGVVPTLVERSVKADVFRRRDELSMPQIQKREPEPMLPTPVGAVAKIGSFLSRLKPHKKKAAGGGGGGDGNGNGNDN